MHSNTVLHRPALSLRRAGHADLPGVLALLAEAAEWLHRRGVRQWPRGGFGAERIVPLIEEAVLYVLEPERDGAGPVAVVAVDGHADPEFWTPADEPAAAMYVHKLAVSRSLAGQGAGEALLDWAGLLALVMGKRWLRLDCAKANLGLQDYYRGRGFQHVRTVDLPHRASGALFQRRAGVTSGDGLAFRDRTAPRPELVGA
ncbi:ribosomal protein S18 acetylase RimI-like enzyme [Thermocatellispora tengchongensis]|uniref:Ribosomal protein S18 acetylase RimI-like enzyme n=1 Tax=Thermocatellispora tengchongensis TaxID=1073253 RepID=A0A840PB52_9ACTN|nr:GNAT family N-acetyltransferase [Thermocatellispora tengchongensis]MBB5133225.1 ribosomal protein S18 acetylase RimI-like enzyme [Thermocatellispora tengchongensis]